MRSAVVHVEESPTVSIPLKLVGATCLRPGCGKPLPPPDPSGGRPAKYCSSSCRSKAYRARQAAPKVYRQWLENLECTLTLEEFAVRRSGGEVVRPAPVPGGPHECYVKDCTEISEGPACCAKHRVIARKLIRKYPIDISTGSEVKGKGPDLRFEPGYYERRQPLPEE
jgi:hypothetical protein